MIAYLDDEPNTILAYNVYSYSDDKLIIHFAFTKSPFQRQGVQKAILDLINPNKLDIVLTCLPYQEKFIHKITSKNIYDPFFYNRGLLG